MSKKINKITNPNLNPSIFDEKILNKLVFNTSINQVFIFTVDLTGHTNNISKYWHCLSVKEKIQADQYHTKALSHKYVISHGILRLILSYYTKQCPQDIEFTHNEYGKPFLKNSNIYFNMSHSHNKASYIVALNYKVGIDIEYHDDNLDVMRLSDFVLTSQEIMFLKSSEDKEKLATFYRLWTMKESLIKANGQGLSYPINSIEALNLLPGDKILLTNKEDNLEQELYIYKLKVSPAYSGFIAIECKVDQIIYLEATNQEGNFNKARVECLN